MALTFSTQAVVAFKNLSGKSNTDVSKGVNNEAEGIFFNVDANSVWTDVISPTPSISIASGNSVFVSADLILDNTSNGHSYFAQWPSTPPSGIDPITSASYSYGTGVLVNAVSGDRVSGAIPPSYGFLYEAKPYSSGPTLISPGDSRNWIYQYNSGVFFQQDNVGPTPTSISVYVYTGRTLGQQQDVASSNIRVSASGIDNYSGIATPSIATYSATDLYLVDFDNVNTGATATLNINGLGAQEIIKFDEFGPIGLTAGGEINVGQIYYVTWDGNNFQLFDMNPQSSSPVTYTNASPVPTTLGGIVAGMTFSDTTMKQMWDLLLYPYQQPNFTAFSFNHGGVTREVGNNLAGGTYSFTWATSYPVNVQSNSVAIKNNTTGVILISATANDGVAVLSIATVSTVAPATHQWKISALRTNSTVISTTITIGWYWKRFNGTQSATSLSAVQIAALNGAGSGALASSRAGTYVYGAGSYKYFAWPTSFGTPVLFRDSATNLAVAMAGVAEGYTTPVGVYYAQIVSVTNTYGKTTNYYVFRTRNILGGSINIVVT
jgi:hypothetical protein